MTNDVKPPFDLLDLRPVTRDNDDVLTSVRIYDNYGGSHPWIRAGVASLQKHSDHWQLKSHLLAGYFDEEHDSSYAFGIELVGVTFEFVHASVVQLHAWIRPNHEDGFRVPPVDYDYANAGQPCHCERFPGTHHYQVPFFPDANAKLYRKLAGCKVGITFGPGLVEG